MPEHEPTTTELPSGNRVHLHQLVVDEETEWCVTSVTDEDVELTDISLTEDNTVAFGQSFVVNKRELEAVATPKYATDGEPIWAY